MARNMIDPERERMLTLAEAARFVAETSKRKKPSVNTVLRWCLYGLRGSKLESLKCGNARITSKEAIIRFFQRLAEPAAPQSHRIVVNDARAAEVERKLIARGV